MCLPLASSGLGDILVSIAIVLLRVVKGAVFGRRELQHRIAVMEAAADIDILVVDETQMAPAIDILVVDETQIRI
jgi:hypothetical protein